ncbi:MAG: deoxyribose-phosphate aldolase [Bdellovibrionales bacterium]|nr:deoxyribose-phosphate aldolase [Bdellovibrionales bacterium]
MQANAVNFSEEVRRAKDSLPKGLTEGVNLDPIDWVSPDIKALESLASLIDHTILKPDTSKQNIQAHCEVAKKHMFFSVCVNTAWVKYAKELLSDTSVKVATTVGFPLGAMSLLAKYHETKIAIDDGADEIDMVIHIGALKSKDYNLVFDDISKVKETCGNKILKVILETGLLSDDEAILAAIIAKSAKADFLKTSTGFVPQGASTNMVQRLRYIAGNSMGVKASGGIRTSEQALAMIKAGANRLGVSASLAIIGAGESAGSY